MFLQVAFKLNNTLIKRCFDIVNNQILTFSGYKSSAEVSKIDNVLTHNGTFEEVLGLKKYKTNGIFTIKTQGLPEIKVTERHYFLAVKRIRRYSRKNPEERVSFGEEEWVSAKNLTKDHFIKIPTPLDNSNDLNITEQEAWLIGRYIADGHYDNRKREGRKNSRFHNVIFSIGFNKVDEFDKKISEYHIGWSDHRTVKRARIGSARLIDLVMKCGKGAYNKNIPPEYLALPNYLLSELINGYISGDGSYQERNNSYRATTVSPNLAKSLSMAYVKVFNQLPSYTYTKRAPTCVIEGRTVNQKDTYTIKRFINPQKSYTYIDNNGGLYTPVRKSEYDSNWNGSVYFPDVKSYTIENLSVKVE